jgi:hypothetical protein
MTDSWDLDAQLARAHDRYYDVEDDVFCSSCGEEIDDVHSAHFYEVEEGEEEGPIRYLCRRCYEGEEGEEEGEEEGDAHKHHCPRCGLGADRVGYCLPCSQEILAAALRRRARGGV